MANSNFVSWTTGRSAGFSPLRIRPAHRVVLVHLHRTRFPQAHAKRCRMTLAISALQSEPLHHPQPGHVRPGAAARRLNAELVQPLCNGTRRHTLHGRQRLALSLVTFGSGGGLFRRRCGITELDAARFRGSDMQMTSSSVSSTIGQPRRAAQYGRYPPAQM
jgi:hypothetical protein